MRTPITGRNFFGEVITCSLFFGVIYCLVVTIAWHFKCQPEPYIIELPPFKGRIFSAEKIHAPVFTIEEDFDGISTWNENGILDYSISGPFLNCVTVKAWQPNSKTNSVFQYTQKTFDSPSGWGPAHRIEKIEPYGNDLKVFPMINISLLVLLVSIPTILFIFGIIIMRRFYRINL